MEEEELPPPPEEIPRRSTYTPGKGESPPAPAKKVSLTSSLYDEETRRESLTGFMPEVGNVEEGRRRSEMQVPPSPSMTGKTNSAIPQIKHPGRYQLTYKFRFVIL